MNIIDDKKLKIAFVISSYGAPVPAICGGGVETVMTTLIDQNELYNKAEFIFISPYDKCIDSTDIQKYNNSKFYFIKERKIFKNFDKYFNNIYIKNRYTYRFYSFFPYIIKKYDYYYSEAYNIILSENVDYIIGEDGFCGAFSPFTKKYGRNKILYHIQHSAKESKNIDSLFGGIIAISDFVMSEWVKSTRTNNNNLFVLHNCIDNKYFDYKCTQNEIITSRKKYNISENDFVILYCGRIVKIKGVLELLRAFELINCQDIKLLIVGSSISKSGNSPLKKYECNVRELSNKIGNNVIFTGHIDYEELYKFYQMSDIQIVPTIGNEAGGLVVIEGGLSHLPQIITDSGGMPEYVDQSSTIIINRDNNLIKNLSENIIKLKNNSKLRKIMADKGYEYASKFYPKRYYDSFIDIMQRYDESFKK